MKWHAPFVAANKTDSIDREGIKKGRDFVEASYNSIPRPQFQKRMKRTHRVKNLASSSMCITLTSVFWWSGGSEFDK